MYAILRTLTAVCLLLACAGTGWAQTDISLVAEADTCIREHDNAQRGGSGTIEVRSLPSGPRQNVGYIRFNLGVLTSAPDTGAVFSVTRDAGQSFTQGVMHVYGLSDTFGNTPQGWLESGIRYNNSGLEIPGDGDATTQDLDPSRLVHVGDLPESTVVGDVLSVSGPTLDAFLADRYAGGGLATLLIVAEDASEAEGRFETREGAGTYAAPTLDVVGTLQTLPPDTTAPTVAGASPAPGATDAPLIAQVTATFSEEMDLASITNGTPFFLLDDSSSTVTAAVAYDAGGLTLTLTPDAALGAGVTYTAKVLASVTDDAGNPMAADYVWSFTTESETVPPTVVSVTPTNGEVNVEANVQVQVAFDEAMDPASITAGTFYLADGSGGPVAATTAYDAGSFTATLYPADLLGLDETYTATVKGGSGGVADVSGNPMAADHVWSFTITRFVATIRLAPDADTYLTNDSKDAPTGTHGGKNQWEVRWYDDGGAQRIRIGYVRYNIAGIPPALFASATLEGTFTGSSYNGPGTWNVYGVDDGVTGNDWDESTVNYATAAGLDNAAAVNTWAISDATPLGTMTFDGVDMQPLPFASNTDDLDMSAFLAADTDGLVTLIFMSDTIATAGGEYRIDAKENATPAAGHGPMTLNFEPGTDITDVELTAGPSVLVTWEVRSNYTYGVERTSDDLSASNWVAVASNLVGELVNSYTDSVPVEAQVSYRVINEGEIPPAEYFFEDFEDGGVDWTLNVYGSNHVAGTDWQIGEPIDYGSPYGAPPSGGYNSTNAAGTNLAADYEPEADVSMLSPTIDLTVATAANLSFANYYDTEDYADPYGDNCEVYIRDDTGAEIAGLEAPLAEYSGNGTSWTIPVIELPAEVLGRTIKLEFRLTSDADAGAFVYSGWYIDDVRVSE